MHDQREMLHPYGDEAICYKVVTDRTINDKENILSLVSVSSAANKFLCQTSSESLVLKH